MLLAITLLAGAAIATLVWVLADWFGWDRHEEPDAVAEGRAAGVGIRYHGRP